MSKLEEKKAALLQKKIEQEKIYLEEFDKWAMSKYPNAVKEDNGVFVDITHQGKGKEIKKGDTVEVHYTGMLTNGEIFDSSLMKNKPFSFRIGGQRVIEAWDNNLLHKNVGDKLILISPYHAAYGENGYHPVIPPKATLIFEVEILK
jgi:peptidyl-prolyl cis-trans isomerase A (cyclophilin A)